MLALLLTLLGIALAVHRRQLLQMASTPSQLHRRYRR
jgi:TRAP-type C4-dicarboxylate transport system permease small subunit